MNSVSGLGHSPGQLGRLSTVGPSADMCRAPSMCQTSVPSLGYSSGKSLPAGSLHLGEGHVDKGTDSGSRKGLGDGLIERRGLGFRDRQGLWGVRPGTLLLALQ